MKAALLGYGTVGRSLDALLAERPACIEITRIFRRPGKTAGDPRMTDDFSSILADPSIDVVVEALAGEMPAARFIAEALQAGKHVVTANKAAIAPRMKPLLDMAAEKGVSLGVEASAGGVVPWIANLRRAAAFDRIDRFAGILNGTGNFIIDRMSSGLEFNRALEEAQAKGYAEADPSADIGGADLANKALVTAAAAFGLAPESPRTAVPTAGLEGISLEFMKRAAAAGKIIRFMAFGRCAWDDAGGAPRLALGAAPLLLPADSLEAGTHSNYNLARFWGDVAGPLAFFGQGAGGRPTADALIADLLAIAEGWALRMPALRTAASDERLLFGTAHFADGTAFTGTFAGAAAAVKRLRGAKGFMAFEPDEELFLY